ncbi:MAG TPA: hypothetical protein VN461_14645 [Vicinamibacteria bacterium]|jgi:hypothetical protein|nr:hypothetical protein [Vicinamibacteria bacterium]
MQRRPYMGVIVLLAALLPARVLSGQEQPAATPSPEPTPAPKRFRIGGELKANFRHSASEEVLVHFPFPPSFLAPGQTQVFERTTAKGSSIEVSNAALIGEGDFTPDISAKVEVHFLDLYNRNPTSSDDRIALREAWVRFGRKFEALEIAPATSFYAVLGKLPRFTKPRLRRLESYGLWSTAVGRFEELQVEVGGSVGRNFYWRGQIANGNPLFFRDPNALAGDNGTPERAPQPGPRPITGTRPIYESGFPFLYDTKASDVNVTGNFQLGGGIGYRVSNAGDTRAIDALAWYFHRKLADSAPIRGTFYLGDLTLLRGVLFPLPFEGNDKSEYGVNLEGRAGELRLFSQFVHQDIAKLVRQGVEIEVAYRVPLNGLLISGDNPVLTWIQPTVRFSNIHNKFTTPFLNPAPSVGFDWHKLDFGFRLGIIRGLDFTAEYARLDMIVPPTLHPDEWLLTLRIGF